jgi:hypothetical protein
MELLMRRRLMMSDKHDDLLPDVGVLAVQAQFLEEWRTGRHPRLSVYSLRYPQYAGELAELVASLPPDTRATDAGEGAEAGPTAESLMESFPERLWSGTGVARALADIFGSAPAERAEPRVAETRTEYLATREQDAPTPDARHDKPTSD